jgi:hypothetical protein
MKNFNENERQFLSAQGDAILEAAARNSLKNNCEPAVALSESQLYEIARLSNIPDSALESAIQEVAENQVNSPVSINRLLQLWRERGWTSALATISWAIGLWIGIVLYPFVEALFGFETGLVARFFGKIGSLILVFYVSSLISWLIFIGLLRAVELMKTRSLPSKSL